MDQAMHRLICCLVCVLGIGSAQPVPRKPAPNSEALIEAGRKEFEARCAMCHGADGKGGERAPGIIRRRSERIHSEQDLRKLVQEGIPAAGMPAFPLPKGTMDQLIAFVRSLTTPAAERKVPGDVSMGRHLFFESGNCSSCHMAEGRGGVIGFSR